MRLPALPVRGMALGAAGPLPAGEGASEGLGGAWPVQGELPLHPALLHVRYLLRSSGEFHVLSGPQFLHL